MEVGNISIFGSGFVGGAVYHGLSPFYNIKIYDKYKPGYNTLEETVDFSRYIFVCVPTPVNLDDNSQDLSYIKDAIKSIQDIAKEEKVIIVKSTVLPGTTRMLYNNISHLFVFNPEFLTERNYIFDFINQGRIVLGAETNTAPELDEVEKLYRIKFTHTPVMKTTFEAAEMIKYTCNCYFSMKISFMNEMYDICEKMGISFEDVKNGMLGDQRIANSHMQVPGFDGYKGFGGKCFPKDLKSFVTWAKENGHNVTMLEATDEVNERVREVKDWLEITGATNNKCY
jgi:UDPglucose 6-dehydrogenase